MAKFTKTETKLLTVLAEDGKAGYNGIREVTAVRKLRDKGLITVQPCDGTYYARRRDGSTRRGYHPQGMIFWRDVAPAMAERSKAKRKHNREQSAALLKVMGE